MAIVLLTVVTLAYAGYNLFIKVAGDHAPAEATTTVLATLTLQIGAIATSVVFLAVLSLHGGHVFKLSTPTYVYALIAGLCIGTAEIAYLYLFGGVGGIKPLPGNLVIPTVVTGAIVITLIVSWLVFKEHFSIMQLFGAAMIVGGILVLFADHKGHVA